MRSSGQFAITQQLYTSDTRNNPHARRGQNESSQTDDCEKLDIRFSFDLGYIRISWSGRVDRIASGYKYWTPIKVVTQDSRQATSKRLAGRLPAVVRADYAEGANKQTETRTWTRTPQCILSLYGSLFRDLLFFLIHLYDVDYAVAFMRLTYRK